MRTYVSIERTYEDNEIFEICDRLKAAIEQAARVETYGGGPSSQQVLGIVSNNGNIVPQDICRAKVAECGFSFVEGSYHHDPIF